MDTATTSQPLNPTLEAKKARFLAKFEQMPVAEQSRILQLLMRRLKQAIEAMPVSTELGAG